MLAYEIRNHNQTSALALVERDNPRPGPGQVAIEVKAVSLNYRDLMVLDGLYPDMPSPIIPLSDGVGVVTAVGDGVTRVKPGDRVAGLFDQNWLSGIPPAQTRSLGGESDGVLAQQILLHQDGVVQVPRHLTDEEAATLPCAAVTAWNALMAQGELRPGETVLIQGTGGVSLFALQFSQLAGAQAIVISGSDEKLELARRLGANQVLNYKQTPNWDEAILTLTENKGVDHVIEIGGPATLPRSVNAIRKGGQINLIGLATGMTATLGIPPILVKQIRMQGIYVGSRLVFEQMNSAIELHKLRPVVDRVFSFDDAIESYEYMRKGDHSGKICISL